MDPNQLFSAHRLDHKIDDKRKQLKNEIENIDPDDLLKCNSEKLASELEERYLFDIPHIIDDKIQLDYIEAKIDVSQDRGRDIRDRSRPFLIDGTEFILKVPFSGDSFVFRCAPSTSTHSPPSAFISPDNYLVLSIQNVDSNETKIRNQFNNNLSDIKRWLNWSAIDIESYNSSLGKHIRNLIDTRRKSLLKNREVATSLGWPLVRRKSASKTYVVPTVRKKLPSLNISDFSKPESMEPTLDMENYEYILSVISNMTKVMECSPKAFKTMEEPDLRFHFLVQLNGQYEGRATGETFNYEGKSDIIIKENGNNIFIAECKFWDGPKALTEAIDQLLGYASWRDTKLALLIFNRKKNLTGVLNKIPDTVKGHSNYIRELLYDSETGFRFIIKHKDDPDRELTLTILVFDIPV